jgi:hypothetical protein
MILLCDFKGAMQLDHSKNMSVHVSTCTSYNVNTLTPVVWEVVALKRCVVLHLVTNKSDQHIDVCSDLSSQFVKN